MGVHIIDLHFQGIDQAIAAFLIESPGGPIVIESGPYSTFPAMEAALRAHGYALADVQALLLSHIHFDHAGAAWAFARAGVPIYVHPKGKKHLAAPERLYESARRIYQDQMDVLWGAMEAIDADLLHTPEDGQTLQFGEEQLTAHYTPGHASHHIAWAWQDTIFTGDVAGVKIGSGLVQPPCPPPDIQIEEWVSSIDKLLSLSPTSLYLTHYGQIIAVEEHLLHLREELHAWADWMKPHWEADTAQKEIIPQFMAFVQERLLAAGVPQKDLRIYEAANPSWMSVAGLMRYWQKRSEKIT